MFKIWGMYEALKDNCISLKDERTRAKYKMLYGVDTDDLIFSESLYQDSAKVVCDNMGTFTFLYKVPTYDMNFLDFTHENARSIGAYIKALYRFERESTIDRISDVYDSIEFDIDHMIGKAVHDGKKLYTGESVDVYCGIINKLGIKFGVLLGVSGDDVLFVVSFDITHNSGIFNFEDVIVKRRDDHLNFEFVSHDFVVYVIGVMENSIDRVFVKRR